MIKFQENVKKDEQPDTQILIYMTLPITARSLVNNLPTILIWLLEYNIPLTNRKHHFPKNSTIPSIVIKWTKLDINLCKSDTLS